MDLTGTDLSRDPAARRYQRLATEVDAEFAARPGELQTLEGPVSFGAGDALLTGEAGDRWPTSREQFEQTYQQIRPAADGRAARYRRRPSLAWARQMNAAFSVRIRDGRDVLRGNPGDWLVQHEPGRYAVVAASIFADTYSPLPD